MVVIFSANMDEGTPMVFADGYYPVMSVLKDANNRLRNAKFIQRDIEGESNREIFQKMSCRLINYERDKRKERSKLHHLILSKDRKMAFPTQRSPISGIGNLTKELVSIGTGFQRDDYCVNIIADPSSLEWDRLQKYTLNWLSVTGFDVKRENDYHNLGEFDKAVDNLFARLQDCFYQPMDSVLEDFKKYSVGLYHVF